MACLLWILVPVGLVLVTTSIVRWFEQVTEGVERKRWNRVIVLLAVPPATWLFPSRVRAGRPVPAPLHEPVLGFGLSPSPSRPEPTPGPTQSVRPAIDPDQVEKLRRKMKDQGLLDDDA